MKLSLIIIFTLLFFVKSQNTKSEQYEISTFINYLQSNGIWQILIDVKFFFGADVSIEVCKEFVGSPHCDEAVRIYIPNKPMTRGADNGYLDSTELMGYLEKNHYLEILQKFKSKPKPKIKIIEEKFKFKTLSKEV